MDDKISYFNSDNKCYESKFESNELNNYINKNFNVYEMDIANNSKNNFVENCKDKTLNSNKDFFLVTDFEKKNNNYTYKCLVPKVDKLCDIANISDLLNPFNRVISDFFKTNKNVLFSDTLDIKQNIKIDDLIKTKKFNKCFNVTDKDKKSAFAKNGRFILYKTELINNVEYINSLDNITPYKQYKDYLDYVNNLSFDNILNNGIGKTFKEYICNPNKINENKFNKSLFDLKNIYNSIFANLDKISLDISNISILTKYETLYLKEIQKQIDKLKNDLNSLIGFDGANNGKLRDTRFLKNITLSETIILIFMILLVVVLYRKNKI